MPHTTAAAGGPGAADVNAGAGNITSATPTSHSAFSLVIDCRDISLRTAAVHLPCPPQPCCHFADAEAFEGDDDDDDDGVPSDDAKSGAMAADAAEVTEAPALPDAAVWKCESHSDGVMAVAWSPNGDCIASGGCDDHAFLARWRTGESFTGPHPLASSTGC